MMTKTMIGYREWKHSKFFLTYFFNILQNLICQILYCFLTLYIFNRPKTVENKDNKYIENIHSEIKIIVMNLKNYIKIL